MKIDITSMFFNSKIEGQTATPAWGTSIGQNKTRECRIDDFKQEIVDIIMGMTYKSISDLRKLDVSKVSSSREIIQSAVFDRIFINNQKIDNAQYVLLIVREHSQSHDGRLLLTYAPYIAYNRISNQTCINKMQEKLGCTEKGCWFVYDITIKNQSDLYFNAVVVNPTEPMVYSNSIKSANRSAEWKSLIPDGVQLPDITPTFRPLLTAIRSKPFLLLAGISGTGKSRIVRELARACWDSETEDYKAHKPKNFEMIQVKPNWHDSTELIGYISRVSGKPEFVAGDFLKFVVKAWEEPDIPYFLCLDEMNLAPVEQYFAEYLSVIESRKFNKEEIVTDPLLKKDAQEWYHTLVCSLTTDGELQQQFLEDGITIPQNLIVVGTVNMDETTFSFSRKVLDRAMTIEMNKVDLRGGLTERHETIGKINFNTVVGNAVEGVDVYDANQEVCNTVIEYLQSINDKLNGTPFKIAYRTRNEFLLYVVNNLPYSKDEDDNDLDHNYVIARALDEITSMKILSRIEGDEEKTQTVIQNLKKAVENGLKAVCDSYFDTIEESVSLSKLNEMEGRLKFGYTSFWS